MIRSLLKKQPTFLFIFYSKILNSKILQSKGKYGETNIVFENVSFSGQVVRVKRREYKLSLFFKHNFARTKFDN